MVIFGDMQYYLESPIGAQYQMIYSFSINSTIFADCAIIKFLK